MTVCRLSPLAVVALIMVVGCNRPFNRPQPTKPTAPPEPTSLVPVPTPPSPPPLAPAQPLPAVADAPGLLDPAAFDPAGFQDETDADGTRRKERQKRRQDRREGPAKPPDPIPAPAPPPASPPAAPMPPAAPTPPAAQAPPSDRDAVVRLVQAAAARWATVPDFEARLVKREVANGKVIPQNEVLYRYRQSPHSVYMKVLAGPGEGREVLYVAGRFGDKMHVVTGKGDNVLVGAGFKTELDPHDKQATAKSRYKVTEAGFGRVIGGLQKQLAAATASVAVRPLGAVKRPEYPYPLDVIEGTFRPGDDPLLPKGGTRQIFFDPKPDSPGYRLPVLVVANEPDGREVEYYSFDRLKVPSGMTDADWNPDRLKRR